MHVRPCRPRTLGCSELCGRRVLSLCDSCVANRARVWICGVMDIRRCTLYKNVNTAVGWDSTYTPCPSTSSVPTDRQTDSFPPSNIKVPSPATSNLANPCNYPKKIREPFTMQAVTMSGTQIIGYAEPWIVSPGEPVDIKVF